MFTDHKNTGRGWLKKIDKLKYRYRWPWSRSVKKWSISLYQSQPVSHLSTPKLPLSQLKLIAYMTIRVKCWKSAKSVSKFWIVDPQSRVSGCIWLLTFDSSKLASLKCEQEFLPQSPKLDAGPNFPQDNSEPLQSVGWKHNIGGKKMGETCSKLGTGTPPPNKFYFIQLRVSKGLFPGNMIILAN